MMGFVRRKLSQSDLGRALLPCANAFLAVAALTAVLNVIYLTGSIYMMEVYDRVIPSRSGQTLLGLSLIVILIYAFQAFMDVVRVRMLVRISIVLDQSLRPRVFDALLRLPLTQPLPGDPLAPLHDADHVRNFVGGTGLATLFDLPWIPFYLAICFLFHPLVGLTALIGALIIIALAVVGELNSRHYNEVSLQESVRRAEVTMSAVRNAEAVKAMGMQPALTRRLDEINTRYIASFREMGDIIGGVSTVTKVFRLGLQSAVLGVGAYLVINDLATPGVIIASSILSSRALAPVEAATANWKGMMMARTSWERLDRLFRRMPETKPRLKLPAPTRTLTLQGVAAGPPGTRRITISDVSFELSAGAGLGVVGASASGKSTLVRTIVGAWPTLRGHVRLDGAAIDNWAPGDLGQHVGYLPQLVELFSGTVAENISRFDTGASEEMIFKAATIADVHQMILDLPDGYDTQIGQGGMNLSAGQRQRVGLARALYGDPFLVVLDEPNSNLDSDGERALIRATQMVRARGGIVIIVAHQMNVLAPVDQILLMSRGRMMTIGDKTELMRRYGSGQAVGRSKQPDGRSLPPAAENQPALSDDTGPPAVGHGG
jgi:PrtD family type I secretion system ABC transporter